MRKKVYIFNGPNLNMLGRRETELYGNQSFEDYLVELRSAFPDIEIDYRQTNHEGNLIDWIQQTAYRESGNCDIAGIVLNAGGLTHTSVSLRDAVAAIDLPVIEVHITNIYEREPFRRISLLTDVCAASIIGHGLQGYKEAIEKLIQ